MSLNEIQLRIRMCNHFCSNSINGMQHASHRLSVVESHDLSVGVGLIH